jgi:heme oxygenase
MPCRRRLDADARSRHCAPVSARATLRTATAASHEAVDAAFGAFDLSDAVSYGRFLTAHARALPAIEKALAANDTLPPFRPRTALLEQDLATLGLTMPNPLAVAEPASDAAAFGALYVIEGSRLGGAILARAVPSGLPRGYLAAIHRPGAWRAFGEALDRAAEAGGESWLAQAIASASATFDLYAVAARTA